MKTTSKTGVDLLDVGYEMFNDNEIVTLSSYPQKLMRKKMASQLNLQSLIMKAFNY